MSVQNADLQVKLITFLRSGPDCLFFVMPTDLLVELTDF